MPPDEQNQVLDFTQAYEGMQNLQEQPLPGDVPINEQPASEVTADNTVPAPAPEAQPQPEAAPAPALAQNDELIQRLTEQNAQLRAALQAREQPQPAGEQPAPQQEEQLTPPMPDWNELYDDEQTVMQKKQNYANKMAEYSNAQMLKQIAPALQYAQDAMKTQERNAAIQELSSVPELKGIADMIPQLDAVIAKNKGLQGLPAGEAYLNAFTLMKGLEAIRQQSAPQQPQPQQQAPTPEQLLEMYKSNQQFQQLVEQERVSKLQGAKQVPAHNAGGGAANIALNVPKQPATFDDAKAFFNSIGN